MSVICRRFLLKLALRTKTHPCKYFVYMDRGNPSQEWRVNYANSNILWHFLTAIIWLNNSSLTDAKICVTVRFLLCVTLNLRAVSKYKPLGAYIWRSDLTYGFFALQVWGAYTWRGLFSEFYSICCHWPRACSWKSAQPSD